VTPHHVLCLVTRIDACSFAICFHYSASCDASLCPLSAHYPVLVPPLVRHSADHPDASSVPLLARATCSFHCCLCSATRDVRSHPTYCYCYPVRRRATCPSPHQLLSVRRRATCLSWYCCLCSTTRDDLPSHQLLSLFDDARRLTISPTAVSVRLRATCLSWYCCLCSTTRDDLSSHLLSVFDDARASFM